MVIGQGGCWSSGASQGVLVFGSLALVTGDWSFVIGIRSAVAGHVSAGKLVKGVLVFGDWSWGCWLRRAVKGCWPSVVGRRSSVIGPGSFAMGAAGQEALVKGCWPSVIGHWVYPNLVLF